MTTTSRVLTLLPLWLVVSFAAGAASGADENTIYRELLEKGVPLSNGQSVKLQKPALEDGLNPAAQQKVLAGLVPANRLQSFLAGGLNDWNELKMKKEGSGWRVDSYFVANGKLETVADKNFMKQQFGDGGGGQNKAAFLTAEELKDRNLTVVENEKLRERYAHAQMNLFNQVEVSGTGHGIQSHAKESEIIAFILDPRFAEDPKYPNQWRSIKRGPAGAPVMGAPQPYAGAGAYLKVTRLQGSTPQVFAEYHLVFDEPQGWFNGQPVLTSKLPDKFRSDIRQFRRDLGNYEKEKKLQAGNESESAPQTGSKQAAATKK